MDAAAFEEQFMAGMDDDLNTPKALAALFDLSREMNRQHDEGHSISDAQDCLRHLGSILGLTFNERASSLKIDAKSYNAMAQELRVKISETGQAELAELFADSNSDVEAVSAKDIDRLVDIRTTCRTYKQFGLADEIRGWLESQGVTVEDSAAGSIWEYRPTS